MADKIMLIRHAEKPDDGGVIHGVNPDGRPDPRALSVLGWQRAGALVRFFAPANGQFPDPRLARPDALFATAIRADSPSRRPAQTLEPLAAFLGIPLDLAHARHEAEALVAALREVPGVALVAWTHRTINQIAALLLGGAGVPRQWPDRRFDLVWVFDRAGDGWSLAQVPQMLLAGDATEAI